MPSYELVVPVLTRQFAPEQAKAILIQMARQGLAEFMARQGTKPDYSILVDGRPAASEAGVKPFGRITYVFSRMRGAATFALEEAIAQSPVKSGAYKKAWFLMAGGSEIAAAALMTDVREVILTNDQPYSRKIEVRGAKLAGVPPGIVERLRQIVQRRYPSIVCEVRYISLGGGYVLKRHGRRSSARPGRRLTYPALAMTQRAAV